MYRPIVVVGGGGHAKVVIDTLLAMGAEIRGIVELSTDTTGVLGIPVIGDDAMLLAEAPESVLLTIGVGSVGDISARRRLYDTFSARGFRFATVVHPASVIGREVDIQDGAQIMAGATIQTGTIVGRNAIVNTNATVDHDCRIGDHAHVAPGATLSGGVTLGVGGHVGTGASIRQGVQIGPGAIIGAGATLTQDAPANAVFIEFNRRIR